MAASTAGTVKIAINVTFQSRRKINRTKAARTMPIKIASRVLCSDAMMRSLWSYQSAIFTPSGICFLISRNLALMPRAISTVFPDGC